MFHFHSHREAKDKRSNYLGYLFCKLHNGNYRNNQQKVFNECK